MTKIRMVRVAFPTSIAEMKRTPRQHYEEILINKPDNSSEMDEFLESHKPPSV